MSVKWANVFYRHSLIESVVTDTVRRGNIKKACSQRTKILSEPESSFPL